MARIAKQEPAAPLCSPKLGNVYRLAEFQLGSVPRRSRAKDDANDFQHV